MNKHNVLKKGFVVGIIALFVSVTFSSMITAQVDEVNSISSGILFEGEPGNNEIVEIDISSNSGGENDFHFLQDGADGRNMLSCVYCPLCPLDTEVVDDFDVPEVVNVYESRIEIVTDSGSGYNTIKGVNVFFYKDIGNKPSTVRYAEREAVIHTWYSGGEYFGRLAIFVQCYFEHVVLDAGKWWVCYQPVVDENCFWLTNNGYGDKIWVSYPDDGHPKWTYGYDVFGDYYDVCFFLRGNYGEVPPDPDLKCRGSIDWYGVEPGYTITDSFYIENAGEYGSLLLWEIESYPDWGEWTFYSDSGALGGGEGNSYWFEVKVPDIPERHWFGELKIVNKDNPDEFCIIPVYLYVPFNYNSVFHQLFKRHMNQFFLLQQLLLNL